MVDDGRLARVSTEEERAARRAERVRPDSVTAIPTKWIGPIRITSTGLGAGEATEEVEVPLATYESPLWPSCNRGADVSRMVEGGYQVTVLDERMTRSVIFVARSGAHAAATAQRIAARRAELEAVVEAGSRFAKLIDIHTDMVGNLLYVRFAFTTGDASGHNMATQAAEAMMSTVLSWDEQLSYGSISGNTCIDKKPSAINGILGRGRSVVVDICIPRHVVEGRLHTTAARINALNYEKNWVGSSVAGALRSANAHYANMLLAVYLATGQDAANIVEGSQGFTHTELRGEDLYFSCTLPHLIVGTVGNGKDLDHVNHAMERLGLRENRAPGANARRLAVITAGAVACGELSLLAAQTNQGELMNAHRTYERGGAGQAGRRAASSEKNVAPEHSAGATEQGREEK